jgi:hypothetical protein
VDAFQLELGNTATDYEQYVSTEQFIFSGHFAARSIGSVFDSVEFRNGKAYRIIRNWSVAVSGIVSVDTTNYPLALDGSMFINYLSAGGSDVGVVGTDSTTGNGFLVYQLATPFETEIEVSGNLQGHPNGTVYIEDATYEVLAYSSGLTTALDIDSVIECVKIGTDGTQTIIAVADITLTDGQVSAIADASAGDIYYISYYYTGAYCKGLTTVTYYDDRMVVLGSGTSAGKVYKITPTVVDDNIVWAKTEV